MLYTVLSVSLALLAATFIFVSIRTLWNKQWLRAWLRGTLSLGTICLSLILLLIAWDFISYRVAEKDHIVATVAIQSLATQEYQVEVTPPQGETKRYVIKGDLWQLDARLITWSGPLQFIGMTPGYRLDRISGRYSSLAQERDSVRTVYSATSSEAVFDVWGVVDNNPWIPWVSAKYGSATYLPMKDGAQYSVKLNQQGLIALPTNQAAEQAVQFWK